MKTTLIAGKDYPSGAAFSTFALETDRNVIITIPAGADIDVASLTAKTVEWNRPSPISARAAIMKAINEFKCLDELVLVFDAQYYAPDFASNDLVGYSHAIDDLILGYCYMAYEAASFFEKQGSGRIIFVLKYTPTGANPMRSGPEVRPASIPLSVAQESFVALAENFAARYEINKQIQISLVRADSNSDNELCTWLFPFFNEIQTKKTSGWLKVGAKTGGVFSFLKTQ